jgi:hypothetical protein
MPFNTAGFLQTPWVHRTQEVEVPELQALFDPGERAVFVVRGLTANEIARANGASDAHRRAAALADALTGGSKSEITNAVKASLGRGPDLEPDIPRRMEMVCAGCVSPLCDMEMARTLQEFHGVILFNLSNVILSLSGQGSDVEKKPSGSTATPASKPPSSSPN